MSSSSDSPYKSRLLSFVNRHIFRFSDRLQKTARHLKVAGEWGAQMLLYPVYLLVQTGRTAGKRLQQSVDSQSSSSEAQSQQLPPSDGAIEQVLEVVHPWLSTAVASPNLSKVKQNRQDNITQSRVTVGGVASLLQTRALVLVTPTNQILDILTPNQQRQLQKRISWEMADYWYHRRGVKSGSRWGRLPSWQQSSKNVLAPVRLFWQAMQWVQKSRMAIALDLFGESALKRWAVPPQQTAPQLPPTAQLTPVERKIAFLEQKGASIKVWGQKLRQRFGFGARTADLLRAAVDYFFGTQKQELPQIENSVGVTTASLPTQRASSPQTTLAGSSWINRVAKFVPANRITKNVSAHLGKLRPKLQLSLQPASEDPFQIRVLIGAAIDYFFGNRQPSIASVSPSETNDRSLPQSAASTATEDPWLSWSDLFAQTGSTTTKAESKPPRNSLPKANIPASTKPGSPLQTVKRYLQRQKPSVAATTDVASGQLDQSPADSLEQSPDWIETEAIALGYIKHPLEKILGWLDRLILWLEELIVKIWRSLFQKTSG